MNTALKTMLPLMLCAAATTSASAEELGRLFFTTQQRALLERGQKIDTGKPGETAPPDTPDTLTINGIVQKHGGERTVWINGVPQQAGKSDERAPESVPVAVPGQPEPVEVKVGQKVLLNPSAPPKTEKPLSPVPDDD